MHVKFPIRFEIECVNRNFEQTDNIKICTTKLVIQSNTPKNFLDCHNKTIFFIS